MLNKTMYKGKTNSPTTQLSEAINSIDTVIKVSNPNVFPEGPNIATIGTDSDAETILYATKTSEGLSGVTRGLEGTAKNWGVGELIARNFTAKDHNDLIENVEYLAENQEEFGSQLAQIEEEIKFKGALLKTTANQAIANEAVVNVSWGAIVYDTNNFYNAAQPTRLTVPANVTKVKLRGSVSFAQNGTGRRVLGLRKNGTFADGVFNIAQQALATEETRMEGITPALNVVAGDYFEVFVIQSSTAALNLSNIVSSTFALEVVE